uniref:Reverse transcriptase/retrotransposon-derived protein RNase H-like domain-containing protein n=1 Tax=Fagus sylvatica TaxID=28930 RepID=A0A2N9FIS6_FAGSY
MAGEKSEPGPSEQEIRMVALERKKEDDKDTSEGELEGHSNTNATPPRPPTPPKPEGKDSQLDSKIDSLEEKIRLIQGLNSFGNTDFSSMSWFPNMTVPPKFKAPEFEKYNGRGDPMIHLQMYCRKMAPYADNEPLLIQTFQDTLTGNAAEWYSQLKKISHLEGTGRHLPSSIRVQLPNSSGPIRSTEDGEEEVTNAVLCRSDTGGRKDRGCLEDKEDSGHDGSDGISRTSRQEDSNEEEGRGCANDREKQWKTEASPPNLHHAIGTTKAYSDPDSDSGSSPGPSPQMPARPVGNQPNDNRWPRKEPRQFTPLPMPMTELYPILIEKNLISPTILRPYNGAQRKDFNQNLTCDFHFGEVGHAIENCNHLRHRIQDLIDHGILKFEGLPNITTNPLPNHPEGGVNMVEIEEGNEERISWRRLFYTLEKKRHITPLEAPPGPSTGDACEYHSGARGHSLECCEEFKKKVTYLMENGLVGREEIPSEKSHQPEDPSDFDWYAELNLDDIVEDEMDLDNLQDEGADWGYFMEDDTDEWRDVDFTKLFQFPCLIVPPGFETPEFEIFYENGDPEVHLQKYGEKMALHLENELLDDLGVSREPVKTSSRLEDEEPYVIPDPGVDEVIVEIKEESSMLSLPALTEGEEEEKVKPLPPAKDLDNAAIAEEGEEPIKAPPPSNSTTAVAEEEYAGPMVEGLSIHTIAKEEDSTTPPTRHCQQGEEAKMWTCVPLLQRVSSSNEITRKTSNDPHVSEIDNKTNCSLDNIDNSDEEIELPNDILEALERQDEGSKPNIEELGNRQIWPMKEKNQEKSYQDMPGLDTDIVVHKIPLKPECKPVKQALRRMKPEVILKIKEEVEKQLKAGFLSTVTYSDWVANIVPVPKKDGKVRMCVDYRDLNRASPKDNFPLPHIDTLVDNTATNVRVLIHGRILRVQSDQNGRRRQVQDCFRHTLGNLRIRCHAFRSSHRPTKAVPATEEVSTQTETRTSVPSASHPESYWVSSSAAEGIEIDPAKVQAIRSMPAPKTEKEIRSFLGRINYIARFIAQLTATCEPLFKLLRKDVKIKWTEDCQRAFDKIKEYLLNPPILVPPTPGRPLILYPHSPRSIHGLHVGTTRRDREKGAGNLLSQQEVHGARDPLLVRSHGGKCSYLSSTSYLWLRKAIKGQAIADYLADYPSEQLELMDSEFPDEDVMTVDEDNHGRWKLYFDGAANAVGSGIGAVLVSPKGQQTPIAVKLGFDCTNNMTEYEACIVGLQAALEFGTCIRHVQTCHKCQMYQNSKNAPPQYLHTMASPWPFSAWGMDVIGAITPKASNGHEFILVAIDYFTKWVEACSFKNVTQVAVTQVCEEQHHLPLRNARNAHHRQCFQPKQPHDGPALSAVQDPASQLCTIPSKDERSCRSCQQKREEDSKQDDGDIQRLARAPALCFVRLPNVSEDIRWSYSLLSGLWDGSSTTSRSGDPFLRILSQTQLEEAEWAQARYEQLNFIDEKRLAALCTTLPETDRKLTTRRHDWGKSVPV